MTTTLLQAIIAATIGTVIMVNGVALKADDMIASAVDAVNSLNIHQLATAVELYYADYGEYPNATNGQELIDILEEESLIRNRPLDANVFAYSLTQSGQDYILKLQK